MNIFFKKIKNIKLFTLLLQYQQCRFLYNIIPADGDIRHVIIRIINGYNPGAILIKTY